MLSLLYSTALFLSNSAEAPRAPAYAPSFCRRTDCNCSPYRTAFTPQILSHADACCLSACRYAGRTRSLIDTLTCQHPRAESRFLFAPPPTAFPPAAATAANRSLIDTLTCQHPRAESRFLFAPPPARFSARRCAGRKPLSYLCPHLSQHTHTESRFLFTPSRRFPLPSRAHNFHPENTLACRPMRPFPPAATPVALALLSTRSPVNTHAPSLGFSSRHRLLPFRLPLQRPQTALLSTRSPVNTRAPSLGFSSRRRQPAFLPAAMPVALALLSMSSPVTTCADSRFLFTPLRRLKLPSRTHGFYTANTLSRRRPLPFRLPLHRL